MFHARWIPFVVCSCMFFKVLTPELLAAIKRHRELMERYGMDHPETEKAFALAMHLSPPVRLLVPRLYP